MYEYPVVKPFCQMEDIFGSGRAMTESSLNSCIMNQILQVVVDMTMLVS